MYIGSMSGKTMDKKSSHTTYMFKIIGLLSLRPFMTCGQIQKVRMLTFCKITFSFFAKKKHLSVLSTICLRRDHPYVYYFDYSRLNFSKMASWLVILLLSPVSPTSNLRLIDHSSIAFKWMHLFILFFLHFIKLSYFIHSSLQNLMRLQDG